MSDAAAPARRPAPRRKAAPLLPPRDSSDVALIFVVAVLCFLACLAAVAALGLGATAVALTHDAFDAALRMAELAHAALGCQGVTRSDLRYDPVKRDLVLLEVNTQPGMTPTSLVPEQAAHQGVSFDDLVFWIVEDAYARGSAGGRAQKRKPSGERPQ